MLTKIKINDLTTKYLYIDQYIYSSLSFLQIKIQTHSTGMFCEFV